MCSSVAVPMSPVLDKDTKSRLCVSRILGNLIWFTRAVCKHMATCETHRAVDLEKASLTIFLADVFAAMSSFAATSRSARRN